MAELDTSPLLSSMVTLPPADRRLVQRARLARRLDEASTCRLVCVRAPAGFGKTSMLLDWIHQQPPSRRIAWLSLQEAHDDPRTLLRYLIAALRSRCGALGEATLTLLNADVPISTGSLVTTLLNELAALADPVWLVLDDLHSLGADGDAADCIARMLEHAPPCLHFIVTTRAAPPFPLGRLRELGQICEIRTRELEFTHAEIASFIARETLALDPQQSARLAANTGGWAAGLRLAAIGMREASSVSHFLDSFSGGHEAIADFLQEDVLSRQPATLQDFLAETAQLDELNPALCDHVLERDDSEALLRAAHDKGLFLVRVTPDAAHYRYHPMFADYLRQRLQRVDPSRAARVCARASAWYARQGADYEAIAYALRAGQNERAAALLEEACERLFAAGRLEALRSFAARLPDGLLDDCPRLLLDLIWMHTLQWEARAAQALMRRVQAYAARHDTTLSPELEEKILHREIMIALLQDDLAQAEALWENWPAVSTGNNPYFDGSAETAELVARREHFDGRFVLAQAPRVRRYFTDAGAEYGTVWFDCVFAPALLMRGESDRAVGILQGAMETAERTSGVDSPLIAMPALLLAEVHYERGELDTCRRLVDAWLPRAGHIGFVDQLVAGYVCAIRLAALGGDHEQAFRLLSQGEALASEHAFARLAVHLASERVMTLLRCGRRSEARGQVAAGGVPQASALLPRKSATVSDAVTVLSHACVARGSTSAADFVRVLRSWVNFAEGHGAVRHAIRLRCVLAGLLHAQGEPAEAWRTLRAAIEQSRVSGIVQPLREDGRRTLHILDFALAAEGTARGTLAATVQALRDDLATAAGDTPAPAVPRSRPARTAMAEALSERQIEILAAIADGSSNKEVAARLGISEATVKWHLRLVYEKLGVHRRVAAVREARALGLVD